MFGYQLNLLIVASVILVIWLVGLGVLIRKDINESLWPPTPGDCPDYWVDKGEGGSACVNVHKLGKGCTPSPMDFTAKTFTGSDGVCAKYRWAKKYRLIWDGISSRTECNETPSNLKPLKDFMDNLKPQ